jgi:hypothetical protein
MKKDCKYINPRDKACMFNDLTPTNAFVNQGFCYKPKSCVMYDKIESLHKIVKRYVHHSDADDLCLDITGWLYRNYQRCQEQPIIDKICDDIWKSCEKADKIK